MKNILLALAILIISCSEQKTKPLLTSTPNKIDTINAIKTDQKSPELNIDIVTFNDFENLINEDTEKLVLIPTEWVKKFTSIDSNFFGEKEFIKGTSIMHIQGNYKLGTFRHRSENRLTTLFITFNNENKQVDSKSFLIGCNNCSWAVYTDITYFSQFDDMGIISEIRFKTKLKDTLVTQKHKHPELIETIEEIDWVIDSTGHILQKPS